MIEQYTPDDAVAPVRLDGGGVNLGRLSTTEEQRWDAIHHMIEVLDQQGQTEGKLVVQWSRGEPTTLQVRITHETTATGKIAVLDRVTEYEMNGAEILLNPKARFARLKAEVDQMAKEQML